MKHKDIIEKLKTSRFISETNKPLSWEETADLLRDLLAQEVHIDTTDERIAELTAECNSAANAAGYELYRPERVLRRYRDLLISLVLGAQ